MGYSRKILCQASSHVQTKTPCPPRLGVSARALLQKYPHAEEIAKNAEENARPVNRAQPNSIVGRA